MPKHDRKGDPTKKFADLTPLQQRVVKFMVDQNKTSADAVEAGLVSQASVDGWRASTITAWCDDYRASRPLTKEELAERARDGINSLLDSSLRVVRDTLVNGEGQNTAVRTAQWVLEGIIAQAEKQKVATPAPGMEPQQSPEEELQSVLRLVRR